MIAPPRHPQGRRREPPGTRGRGTVACLIVLWAAGGVSAADVPPRPDPVGPLARPVPIDRIAADAPPAPAGAARSAWPAAGSVVWLAAAGLALLAVRAVSRRAVRPLPGEVFTLLGEAPMGGTHVARVVRFGPKTVLVGVSGSNCTTLAVIEDPGVTDALAAACRGPDPTPPVALLDHVRGAVARSLAPVRRMEAVR